MSGIDISVVARGLADHIGELVTALFPHGQRLRHEWAIGSLAGEPGQSLRITLSGDKRGLWYDHAEGRGGDALDLVARARFDGDRAQARRWGIDWLGLDDDSHDHRARPAAPPTPPPPPPPNPSDQPEAKRQSAIGLWLAGEERLRGTPVDHYLRGRGIDLERLGRQPRALRYHPELWCEGRYWPAMLAIVRHGRTAEAIGCHCTFLARASGPLDGPAASGRDSAGGWGKAPLPGGAKRFRGRVKGGLIPLWRGRSAKPLRFAPAGDQVVLCEGIEDALTIAIACPEYRVLACLSAGNLPEIELPPQCTTVVIAADNDPLHDRLGRPHAARLAVVRAIARLQAEGRRVLLARPRGGEKDFNAVLMAGATT